MENLYPTIKRETLILEHVSFIFPLSYLPITASFSLMKWLRKRSLKIWHWQMSNYRSYIHVSRLGPPRPPISLADAACEDASGWARQRSRLGRRRAPFWQVVHHRFHLTAGCCVTVPSHRPLTSLRTHRRLLKYLSGMGDEQARGTKPPRYLRGGDISIDTAHFRAGQRRHLGCLPCFS